MPVLVWLGVFGWDDGMEVGSHQKEHPSDGPEEWEGQVRWRWLRMEPSHRHGGVSSGGPPQDLLGPFFYHLMVLEKSWFLREAHPRWHVLAGGTRWRRRSKDPVLCRSGSKGLAPTAVMSVPVSAPSRQSCAPRPGQPQPQGKGRGWGSLELCLQQNLELTQPLNHNGGLSEDPTMPGKGTGMFSRGEPWWCQGGEETVKQHPGVRP